MVDSGARLIGLINPTPTVCSRVHLRISALFNDLPLSSLPTLATDNVGDNVGDVAGMGADLFESYVGSIVATASLGMNAIDHNGDPLGAVGIALPFWVSIVGIVSAVAGFWFVRTSASADDPKIQEKLLRAMRVGVAASSVSVSILAAVVSLMLGVNFRYTLCIYVGLAAGVTIGYFTEYCTSFAYGPTISIAHAAITYFFF